MSAIADVDCRAKIGFGMLGGERVKREARVLVELVLDGCARAQLFLALFDAIVLLAVVSVFILLCVPPRSCCGERPSALRGPA